MGRNRTRLSLASMVLRDQAGAIALVAALLVPTLVVGLAVVVDVAWWRFNQAELQLVADTAAMEALRDKAQSLPPAVMMSDAAANATQNGWTSGKGTITVNNPPSSGSQAGNTNAVEVILTSTAQKFFSSVLSPGTKALSARSVAVLKTASSQNDSGCMLSLAPTGTGLTESGFTIGNCEAVVKSTSPNAVNLATGMFYGTVSTSGSISGSGSATTANSFYAPVAAVVDPYKGLVTVPSSANGPCLPDPKVPANVTGVVLTPGNYCSGITIGPNAQANANNGTYFVGGTIALADSAYLVFQASTLVMTAGSSWNQANYSMLSLTAPTSGPLNGIALTQNTDDYTNTVYTTGKTAFFRLSGLAYMPTKTLFNDGASNNYYADTTTKCAEYIFANFNLTSILAVGNTCSQFNLKPFGTWSTGKAITAAPSYAE